MKAKKCVICGKELTGYVNLRKYCSYQCSRQAAKKRAKRQRRANRKGFKQNDINWALAVKERSNFKCEVCGKTEYLNSHHIFSRSNRSVRWDEDNGVCLCSGHHLFNEFSAHKAPIEFVEWLKAKRGTKWYERLRQKARKSTKELVL